MHATQLLHNYLQTMCQAIHKSRLNAMMVCVRALMSGKTLSVTGIGRSIQTNAFTKHAIKRSDRLIGNAALHSNRYLLYRSLACGLLGKIQRPVIIVDWSDLTVDRHYHILRAATPVGGRTLTLYEEVHPLEKLANRRVQQRFLQTLKSILPTHCCPIVVTDAGFRNPWFKSVVQIGWDFVGRIGGHTMIRPANENKWWKVETIFNTATQHPRYLGRIDLVRCEPLRCGAYLLKRTAKQRSKKTRFGKTCQSRHSLKNAHRERTPWLIVTSLQGGERITKQVLRLYQSRMQIEESFRDIKNQRWGYALTESRTTMAYRFENLLLIGMLATWATWFVGKLAQLKQWHRRFQANSIKSHNVLSTFFVGSEVIKNGIANFTKKEYRHAILCIQRDLREAACFG